jgi:predicted XRE-type DNA-binding protein
VVPIVTFRLVFVLVRLAHDRRRIRHVLAACGTCRGISLPSAGRSRHRGRLWRPAQQLAADGHSPELCRAAKSSPPAHLRPPSPARVENPVDQAGLPPEEAGSSTRYGRLLRSRIILRERFLTASSQTVVPVLRAAEKALRSCAAVADCKLDGYIHMGIIAEGHDRGASSVKRAVGASGGGGPTVVRVQARRRQQLPAKIKLALKVNSVLDARRLSQTEAGRLLGMPQPKISALRNYKLRGISLERLLLALADLDQDVEIVVGSSHRVVRTLTRVPA